MRTLHLLVAVVGVLAVAAQVPAKADAFVDPPSLGRIVYGMTGGQVILPTDAWQGVYPDGIGAPAFPNDAAFGGGTVMVSGHMRYAGDTFGTAGSNTGYDYAWASGQTANATQVGSITSGLTFATGGPKNLVIATKLGFISNYGWESEVDVHQATGSQPGAGDLVTLFAKHTDAASSASVLVGDPFAVAYMSTGAVKNPFAVYSEDPAWNTGSAANKLYNHVKAYQVTSGTYAGVYFLGLEDWSYENTGAKHRRFDWNDTVVQMSVEAVPEPAFYQIAVLIGLGSIGFVRRAVRRT